MTRGTLDGPMNFKKISTVSLEEHNSKIKIRELIYSLGEDSSAIDQWDKLHYLASFNTVGLNHARDQIYPAGHISFSSTCAAATRPTKPARRTKRIVVGSV